MSISNTIFQSQNLSTIFSALGDPTRLKIVRVLMHSPDVCVGELATAVGVSPSAVSQHCKLLELSGILTKDRRGQQTCFELNNSNPSISAIFKLVKENL